MLGFSELKSALTTYLPPESIDKIAESYEFAAEAHDGQVRFSGDPYISHPLAVACILASIHMDTDTIMAALLHDVIEDTKWDKAYLATHFGDKVAELVDGVSKLKQIKFENREHAQAENFRKMMLAMAQDIRVIIIKLADRLHNMRTLHAVPDEKKKRIAQETLEIYAPIAHRLGMNHMRIEFEDLSFSMLHPLRYRVLKAALERAQTERAAFVHLIEENLSQKLKAFQIEALSVKGREKHIYGLYQKMQKQRLSLNEVMDIFAFRVIVENDETCYRVLGAIHSLYRPIARQFKDYIAIPKANGYQSLHTTLIGPHGIPIEVQIRTKTMNDLAENGIAAHWLYKASEIKTDYVPNNEWLNDLLDIQKNSASPLEFIENVKTDLYSDAVYVFTPKGNILSLPSDATPVDFAYMIHTDIGNACVGCKIDRRLAPLNARLKSGQTVEVITAKGAHPDPAWLSFAATGKARSNIRHWLKSQQAKEAQDLGRRLIEEVMRLHHINLENLNDEAMHSVLDELHLTTKEELYEAVGLGKRFAVLVAQRLLHQLKGEKEQVQKSTVLSIKGTEGLVVKYAKCCHPLPGDLVIGEVVLGQGVTVHREQCRKVKRMAKNSAEWINITWEPEVKGEFNVPVVVDVINNRGVLASLSTAFADADVNIVNIHIDTEDGRHNRIKFIITARNRTHLAKIMRRIRSIPEVTRIRRG